jgi:hypothetical protein
MKRIIGSFAIILLAAACSMPSEPVSNQSGELSLARSVTPSAVDSVAFYSSQQNIVTWAPAPGRCAKGLWTGCPRINYQLELYSNGVLVGYATTGVVWSSSDTSIAVINNKGTADVVGGPGTTTITATYDHGRLSTSGTITTK